MKSTHISSAWYIDVVKSLGPALCERILASLREGPDIFHQVDESQIGLVLSFLSFHRIIGRSARLFEEARDESEIASLVRGMYQEELDTRKQRLERLSKFIEQYCFDMELILLKTSYSYQILKDPWAVEPNGDLDFVVDRPNRLVERLRRTALKRKTSEWPDPCHEVEVVVFENTQMELHRYIPIWSAVQRGGRCLDLQDREVMAKTLPNGLNFERLRSGAIPVTIPGGGEVYFSDPTKHLITVISSRYRDSCLYAHANLTKPPIRMSEMLDVQAILNDDESRLEELKTFFRTIEFSDAVRWFGSTMRHWLNDDRLLSCVDSTATPLRVPKLLAGGSWVDLELEERREALTHPTTKDVLERLEVTGAPIPLSAGGDVRLLLEDLTGPGGVALSIGYTSLADLEVVLRFDGRHLTILLPISGDISVHQEFRAYVEINSSLIEFFGHRSIGYLQLRKFYDTWTRGENNSYALRGNVLEVTLDVLPFLGANNTEVDVVLSVGVPQYPRDTDRGWVCGVTCALDTPPQPPVDYPLQPYSNFL